MLDPRLDPDAYRQTVRDAKRAVELAHAFREAGIEPTKRAITSFLTVACRAAEMAERLATRNPLFDRDVGDAMAQAAHQVRQQAEALSVSKQLPDPAVLESLLSSVSCAKGEAVRSLTASRLPSRQKLEEMRQAQLEWLREMDEIYGPPSKEAYERADRLLAELDMGA